MATGEKRKLFFELSKSEKEKRFRSVLNPVLKRNRELNQPVVFRNSLCHKSNQFVHKYPNGKQFIIEIDLKTLSTKLGDSPALMII
ncbi:hypothetical protein [Pedobacter cryoconitis]|uniref:Uncharacterized protein n=1 Tax=Pedobacter cryoconitis TaxID=188932 RepID=A0A7X0IZ87_9SPHI|nr:hypothetical protein [Pedobacter cryoconitis]MBB6498179.1 hypothetical protein [Pedobacter cryoconitis]